MWKPANQPTSGPAMPELQRTPMTPAPVEPVRTAAPTTQSQPQEQASIGKSLVIKGEVTGSESLFIDGKVEGSINLPGNRVTIGRNGVVAANICAREIVIVGKAVYRPSGSVLRIDVQYVEQDSGEPTLFSRVPPPIVRNHSSAESKLNLPRAESMLFLAFGREMRQTKNCWAMLRNSVDERHTLFIRYKCAARSYSRK